MVVAIRWREGIYLFTSLVSQLIHIELRLNRRPIYFHLGYRNAGQCIEHMFR